ncbi:hypothetical protein FHW96_004417, partial [Novosphingobium sp. SG751A]|uniref:hypothetical protein n=1 Tax=Novosphingobium sp. SG751A TaxID=2587000 RepID=UPI001C12C5A6
RMTLDGKAQNIAPDAEYPRLYARFASLIDAGQPPFPPPFRVLREQNSGRSSAMARHVPFMIVIHDIMPTLAHSEGKHHALEFNLGHDRSVPAHDRAGALYGVGAPG